MVNEIGESAGKLWNYLAQNPASTLDEAAKCLKVKEPLVLLAAGWLAREEKLVFDSEGKSLKVSVKTGY
jgi:hypothetical protein